MRQNDATINKSRTNLTFMPKSFDDINRIQWNPADHEKENYNG